MQINRSKISASKDEIVKLLKQEAPNAVHPSKYFLWEVIDKILNDYPNYNTINVDISPNVVTFKYDKEILYFINTKDRVEVLFYTSLPKDMIKKYPNYGYSAIKEVEDYITGEVNKGSGLTFSYHTIYYKLGYPVEWLSRVFNGGTGGLTVKLDI